MGLRRLPLLVAEQQAHEVAQRRPRLLAACQRYITRLGKEVSKYCVGNGGNVLLVQVENEYGSYSNDRVYMGKIRDMLEKAGFNAPSSPATAQDKCPTAT